MLKSAAVAILMLCLTLVVMGKLLLSTRDALATERLRAEQLDGQLTAMVERANLVAEVRERGERVREVLRDAANKTEWGGTAVPTDVVGLLCESAQCIEQVQAPNDKPTDERGAR